MKAFFTKLRASFRTRAWRAGAYSVMAAGLVIAIAVVANLAVGALPVGVTRLDMTKNKMYSISPATEKVLGALDKDVSVYWLVQQGAENNTMEQVLAKYAQFGRVTVTEVDTVRYPGFAAAYTDETVQENSLLVVCGDKSVYIPYSDIWTYSDYDTYYQYMYYYGQEYLDVFAGEGMLTGAIGYVTSDELPMMYYLTGHGETGVSEKMLSAIALENIQTESLNLLTAEAVPADCSVLAIFGPVSDLSARERELVEDYIDAGGQMLITTEYTDADMPNFRAILASYGLELINGYVMESDSRYYNYGYIDLVLPNLGDHAITAPLAAGGYAVMLPDAQAFRATEDDPAVVVTELLTSSPLAYMKADVEGLDSFDQAPEDETGTFVMAAVAENEATGAKTVVFGSTAFVQAEYSDMVSGANEDLFINAADWLCRREEGISIHPKTLSTDYLAFDDSTAGILKVIFPIVIPVLYLVGGVVIFVKRRRR